MKTILGLGFLAAVIGVIGVYLELWPMPDGIPLNIPTVHDMGSQRLENIERAADETFLSGEYVAPFAEKKD